MAVVSGQEFELSHCLNDEEIDSIPEPVRRKLDALLRDGKAEVEKLRVVTEQKCFELERQLQECSVELEAAMKTATEQTKNRTDLDDQLKSCKAALEESKRSSCENQMLLDHAQKQNEILTTEKKDLLAVLDKRNREAESLNEECKSITSQMAAAIAEKFKALSRVDELTSEESILRQHLSRLQQERDSLIREVEHLNADISQTKQRLIATRIEQSHKLIELQGKLDDLAEQLRQSIGLKESFQKLVEEQNQKLEQMSVQLNELRERNIKSEEQWQSQLHMQVKLAELYKVSSDDAHDRVKELMTAVEEMQSLLRLAETESKNHERELEDERQLGLKAVAEKEETILRLKTDLARAEKLLEQMRKQVLSEEEISGLSPSAAAASRLLKSGKSLTEIYSEYVDAVEQLQSVKDENEKLNMYMGQIVKDIEMKAPELMKQREDYEKALEAITLLTNKLDAAVLDHERMQSELNDAQRKIQALKKNEELLDNTNSDLGKQVCELLREIAEAKGQQVDESLDSTVVSSTSSASGMITANLVTFKDIQELQLQNQRLLAVVRELGDKHEQEARMSEEHKISEIQKELKCALIEIEQMRVARDRQKDMVDAIVKQRDMYCVLLNQANQNILRDAAPVSPSMPASAGKPLESPESVSLDEHVSLRTAYDQLNEELAHYKTESHKNTQILQEELEKLKIERVDLRLHAAKLSAQLEFAKERCETARFSLESSKKELSSVVTRNQRLSELVGHHEETVNILRKEVMTNQEKLAKSDVSLENLRLEHSLIKESESRLRTENEILRREQFGQGILMANLQAIQNNLEKSDVESKIHAQTRISLLEKELSTSRIKLEREIERGQAAISDIEKEKREIYGKYQAEIEAHHKTKDELVNSYGILHTARQEVKEESLKAMISKDLDAARNRPIKLARSSGQQGGKDDDEFSLLHAEAQSEIKNLKTQLEQSQQHLDQFKTIASSLQDQLSNQNETTTKLKVTSEKLLKENQEEISKLEEELGRLKNENQSIIALNEKKMVQDGIQVEALQKELASLKLRLNAALQEADEYKHGQATARKDLQEQLISLKEVKENYQRELTSHANDSKALEKLRIEFSGYEGMLSAEKELTRKAEYALQSGQEAWQSRESLFKNQIEQLTLKCEELEKHNRLLHEQMEKMSDQMVALQSKTSSDDKSNLPTDVDESTSNEHLFELIKYLRREREIATTKSEMSSAECQRLQSKVDFLQSRLDETNRLLSGVQQKDEAGLSTSAQHAELLRKVELLNVLTDGNRVLREEKTHMQNQLTAAEEKLINLEAELTPLREQIQEVSTRCEALQVERRALEGEAKRWQIRTQQLTGMRSEKESVQSELKNAQDDAARLTVELATNRAALDELNHTILQVRKIGRKYRTQYDELKVRYDELVAKHQESETQRIAAEKAMAEATSKLEVSGPDVTKAVAAAKEEVKQEMEVKVKELEETIKSNDEKFKKLKQTAFQRIMAVTGQRDEKTKEIDNLNQKYLALEKAQLTNTTQAMQVQSNLESQIKSIESELEELRASMKLVTQEKSTLQKECDTLTQKMNNQQKHIETLQTRLKENTNIKLAAVASSSRESSILSQSGLEGTPPTANIKPMATMPGSSTVRHPHPVNQQSRQTPMGRIRPITPFSQSTRMAAVTPTTSSPALSQQQQHHQQQQQQQQQQQHDNSEAESSLTVLPTSSNTASCVPQAAVAPTPAIHAVTALNTTPNNAATIVSSSMEGSSPQHHLQVSTFSEAAPTILEETNDLDVTSNDGPQDLSVTGSSSDHPSSNDEWLPVAITSEVSKEPSHSSGLSDALQPKVIMKRLRVEVGDEERAKSPSKRVRSDDMPSTSTSSNVAVCPPATNEPMQKQDDYEAVLTSTAIVSDSVESVTSSQAMTKVISQEPELEVILLESDEDEQQDNSSKNSEGDEGVDDEEDVNVYEEDEAVAGGGLSGDDVDDAEDGDQGDVGIVDGESAQHMEGQDLATSVEDYADDQMTQEFQEDDGDKMDEEQFPIVIEEMADDDDDVEIIESEEIPENVEIEEEEEEEEILESRLAVDEGQPSQPMDDRTASGDADTMSTSVEPMEQQPQPIIVQPLGIPIQRHISHATATRNLTTQRLPALSRGQQPAPFPTMVANTSGGFEDGDSIVPSTPTLFDPRKNDGFAEAVSSPQVPPERFLFSSSVSETPSQLASQGALGVDDTRMDLSQLDESSGRSVPSTPLQVSPPDTIQEAATFAGGTDDTSVPSIVIQDITSIARESSTEVDSLVEASSTVSTEHPPVVIVEEPPETSAEQRVTASIVGPSIVEISPEPTRHVGLEPITEAAVAVAARSPSQRASGESRMHPSYNRPPQRPCSNNRAGQNQQGYRNQRRATPIIWDRPPMVLEDGNNPGASPHNRGGGGGQGRQYMRRLRVIGHPMPMRMNRPFHRGGGGGGSGGGGRAQRYQRMNR